MDLTIRDWMVIIGILLILAVFLDAWRRIRSDRYSRVKMKLVDPDELGDEDVDDLSWFRELPNGGARVIERGDLVRAASEQRQVAEPVMDDDDVELVTGMTSAGPADDGADDLDWGGSETASPEVTTPEQPETIAAQPDDAAAAGGGAQDPGRLPRGIEPEVFMLNVVARGQQGFRGEDILHILLACDLRFGDMNFFHRHEFEAGKGAIQFSVANMMQPGVFDLDAMSEMSTPGLVFFVTLPGPEDMIKAFDYMLETAQAVARNLGGDVLDESHSALTRQSMEHCRQQIRDLERRMLAKAP